ncbi:MAG: hypothetical protein NTY15_16460 [Planctomycetota bacterium]|nr:hypothetical protein [Planctomycetota bacterium]
MTIAFAVSTVLFLFCHQPPKLSRLWPDRHGESVRGDIILIRSKEIVIRTGANPNHYLSIPKKSLSESDKKQLKQLVGDASLDSSENLSVELRLIANIHDSRTLLDAASLFRNKDIAFTLSTFESYLKACKSNRNLEPDKLWFLATIIFEHPQPLYPDFYRGNKELVTPRWPQSSLEEIRIVAGTPFWIASKLAHSGPIWPDTNGLLGWIRDHARLRTI